MGPIWSGSIPTLPSSHPRGTAGRLEHMFDRLDGVASWSEFAVAEPRLALAIQELVHQYGPGLGYLATVRADGGPRVHPVSPVITDTGLYCFLLDSPKRRDLER